LQRSRWPFTIVIAVLVIALFVVIGNAVLLKHTEHVHDYTMHWTCHGLPLSAGCTLVLEEDSLTIVD
jgi:hypothetical protein